MTTIFKFLKEYDKSAYKWARNMERTLYKEPLGALAYGGRFIEAIRNALYKKHYKAMSNYNKNLSKNSEEGKINSESFKKDDLSKHISDLYHAKLIKSTDSYKIIHAYNIRHKLHENEDIDDIESDKKAALELYKEVFEIAVWFCKHIDPTFDETSVEFTYPNEMNMGKQLPDVDIVKIFNDCVICGQENISSNRNICPECKRKIRLGSDLDDLIDLLDNENRFTKEFLKKQSYDAYEIDYLLHFLREFDLRSSETKGEFFINYDKSYDFIEETQSYEEIEKTLLAFYNELIDEGDIDYNENSFYRLGESGDERYSQYYLLIITKKIKNYLNLKSRNMPNACEKSGVNIDEISNWYDRKVKNILRLNYKKDLDISFNHMSRILMDKWIEYRESKMKKEDIKSKLKLSETVVGFWLDESLIGNNKYPYIKEFIFKNREIEMKLYVEGLKSGLNKQDAIEFADTSLDFVNKYFNLKDEENLIRRWRIGNQVNNEEIFKTYKNIYFHNKTKEFLNNLKGDTINSALLKTDLDEEDFNNWYNDGKREFYRYNCDLDSDLFRFYMKTTEILMNNWLDERREGHKKLESCKNIGLYSETLDEWFKFKNEDLKDFDTDPKYKTFRDFYSKNHKLEMELVIKSIENGDTATRAAKNADISKEKLDEYYALGRKGKEEYSGFYEKYDEIYLPKRRKEFIRLFEKKKDFNKAVKASELSLEEIESAYERGRNGEEEYEEFYESLLDAKLRIYSEKLSNNEKERRALEKSNLTTEEIGKYDYRIEILVLATNMDRVIAKGLDNKKLEKIVSKSSMEMNDVLNWYAQGREQFEKNDNLEYLLLDEIEDSPEKTWGDFILKDKDYKENIEKDFNSYYKMFYNLHNEFYVKLYSRLISKFLYQDDDIKSILKNLKISKKEFNFWDGLGLIKRGDEAAEEIEERENYTKAMKLYNKKQWKESLEHYKKAFEINPNERLYLKGQVECLEKMEEYEEAIEIYDKLIEMKHYNKKYWYLRAKCLKELGRYEEALESCKKANELIQDDGEILGLIASIYIKLGNIHEALETLSRTEKTIDLEISADDAEKVKEIIENPSYKENIGQLKISKDLDKYFDEEDLKGILLDLEDLDEFLEALETGILPDWENR